MSVPRHTQKFLPTSTMEKILYTRITRQIPKTLGQPHCSLKQVQLPLLQITCLSAAESYHRGSLL